MLAWYRRAINKLGRSFLTLAKLLLALMLVLVTVEIVLRNLFNASTKISDEYSGYLFCWLTLLGFLYVARNDYFIRVDMVLIRLTGVPREFAMMAGSLAGFAVSAVACYASTLLTLNSYRFHATSSQYSETLLFIPQAIVPVAYFLLGVVYGEDFVTRAVRMLLRRRERV